MRGPPQPSQTYGRDSEYTRLSSSASCFRDLFSGPAAGDSFQLEWVAAGRSDEYLGGQMGGIAGDLAADLTRNFSVSDKTLTAATQGQQLARDGAANARWVLELQGQLLPTL